MYIVATLHIALNLYRLLRGYVWNVNPLGPFAYFSDNMAWDNLMHNAILCIMTWLGDMMVIYRCFVIWNNNYYIVMPPVTLLLLSIGTNSMIFFWFTHPETVHLDTMLHWLSTIYPFAFAQNVMTTGMITFKIWKQHRQSSASGVVNVSSRLNLINIMRIIIESAMVYTVQLFILIILLPLKSNAQYIVQSAVVPSIGIVFVLIAVRVHFTQSRVFFGETVMGALPTWLDDSSSAIDSSPAFDPEAGHQAGRAGEEEKYGPRSQLTSRVEGG